MPVVWVEFENMELKEKAWVINKSNIEENYFVTDEVFYAETSGKAKYKALDYIKYESHVDIYGEEMSFLNLKVKREKLSDKYLYEEEVLTLNQINNKKKLKEKNDRLDKLILDNPHAKAYIMKGGMYYGPSYCGYTEGTLRAGVYDVKDVVSHIKGTSLGDCRDVRVINTEEYNESIELEIDRLKSLIIK